MKMQIRRSLLIAVVGAVVAMPVMASAQGVPGGVERGSRDGYVAERHYPSYRYDEDVRVGAVLPESGVTYYDVPQEYGVREYRYTIVNDRTVLVDPRTRRIVEVVE
jgi:hypothetical protein